MKVTLELRICDEAGQRFFGEGPRQLLEGVERLGSLRAAAAEMGMAYTKALALVRRAEKELGFPLTRRSIGGKGGGGSCLTPQAKEWMERYEACRTACDRLAQEVYQTYFAGFGQTQPANRAPRMGCVVLAAGKGQRFGGNKLLAPLGGKPLLAHTLAALPRQRLARLLAVASAPETAAFCQQSGVPCLLYPGGPQSESVRRGLAEMTDLDGCLFLPGDQPLCRRESLEVLLDAFAGHPQSVIRLAWQGRPGSPVVFPAVLFDRLAALSGDVGGMAAVPGSGVPVRLVEAAHPWELWDADTPAALARLEECLAQNDR